MSDNNNKMKVITFINEVGGCGKTSSAQNIAYELAKDNKSVLLLDADMQGSLSLINGYTPDMLENERTIYDVIRGKCNIDKVIKSLEWSENVKLIPANIKLSAIDTMLSNEIGREYILKNLLDTIKDSFDYAIIDCSPSLSIMSVMALTAADIILIPVRSDYISVSGLTILLDLIQNVSSRLNTGEKSIHLFLTLFDTRRKISQDVKNKLYEYYDKMYVKTYIPYSVAVVDSQMKKRPVQLIGSNKAGEAYHELYIELKNKGVFNG